MRCRYLLLIAIHESENESIEFVKLLMLIIFAQFVARYNLVDIDKFVAVDSTNKEIEDNEKTPENPPTLNFERESALLQYRAFEELNLDDLLQNLTSQFDTLFFAKDLHKLAKIKLENVLLTSVRTGQILFHYSFCYV